MGFDVNLIFLTDDQLGVIKGYIGNDTELLTALTTPVDFGTCIKFFGEKQEPELNAYATAAEGLNIVSDGECEIDSWGIVSKGEDLGAYVMAWVWVADSDLDEDDRTISMKIRELARELDIPIEDRPDAQIMNHIEEHLEIAIAYTTLQERYDKARFEFDN